MDTKSDGNVLKILVNAKNFLNLLEDRKHFENCEFTGYSLQNIVVYFTKGCIIWGITAHLQIQL